MRKLGNKKGMKGVNNSRKLITKQYVQNSFTVCASKKKCRDVYRTPKRGTLANKSI